MVKNSRQQIHSLLQRFPLTNKERQELLPKTEKGFSTIFQLFRGGQFYLWRKLEYQEKTTNLS
jgi:hypothetical protein